MNIVFLIWNYWPCIEGGSERQARQISTELASRGHTCTVWTAWVDSTLPAQETKDDCTIMRFGRWVPWQGRVRRILERIHHVLRGILSKYFSITEKQYTYIQKHIDFWILLPVVYATRRSFMKAVRGELDRTVLPPNVIHLHEPSWLGGFAVQLTAGKKISVVCQEATNPVLPVVGYDVPFRHQIERSRRNAHFIAMAPYLAADLYAKGIPKERVHLLPNGVTIPSLAHTQRDVSMVLYVGNFSQGAHWKAFDVLFDAWKIIHDQKVGLRLVVLGGGNRTTWEKYVERLGCASSVDFMGRVKNPEKYYAKASMFVLPSRVEGMSNALLEAMSWGIPAIVSDIPANRSLIRHGINGWVVPVNDSRALADAVITLLADEALSLRLGRAARQEIKESYTMTRIAARLVELYTKLIPKNRHNDSPKK